jgi:hypothetical protein
VSWVHVNKHGDESLKSRTFTNEDEAYNFHEDLENNREEVFPVEQLED